MFDITATSGHLRVKISMIRHCKDAALDRRRNIHFDTSTKLISDVVTTSDLVVDMILMSLRRRVSTFRHHDDIAFRRSLKVDDPTLERRLIWLST